MSAPAIAWHLTLSGRYNRTTVDNRDRIEPGGGPGSLDGDHVFSRSILRPASRSIRRAQLNLYAGYSEGSRAATSIELGCADPEQPCKLPNAMAGDPPLDQVVTRTLEAGVRGERGRRQLERRRVPRATTDDDILFVTSEQTGFGYFRNFGETRRQGIELGADAPARARHARRRLHVPRRDVPERGDGQRREQQHQRRGGGR